MEKDKDVPSVDRSEFEGRYLETRKALCEPEVWLAAAVGKMVVTSLGFFVESQEPV